jgi:hypothetical protein
MLSCVLTHHVMNKYGGVETKLYTFLTLALRSGVLSASYSAALPLEKESLIPIWYNAGGAQSWYGHCDNEKNLGPYQGLNTFCSAYSQSHSYLS